MTSAATLSVVLSLLSQRKEGKRGRSVSHVKKGYEAYLFFKSEFEELSDIKHDSQSHFVSTNWMPFLRTESPSVE